MNKKQQLGLWIFPVVIAAFLVGAGAVVKAPFLVAGATVPQQQSKESLFQQFNDKKRSEPKEAYRLAQLYLRRFGQSQDEETKYVREWVKAYESVVPKLPAGETSPGTPRTPNIATPAPATKTLELNGTTWTVKGKENGRPWATIFSFKAGGRFQSERYGADGGSSIAAGTWRQLDQNIFATLLGPDGNPAGTIRGEVDGACLLVLKGNGETDLMMETDNAPNGCARQREAQRKAQEELRLKSERALAEGRAKAARMPAEMRDAYGIEFVLIQPGKFMMGSSDGDQRQHEVTISQPFYIGKYEVTQAQWQSVMGSNPSSFDECGGNCPVENVSWDDAQGFISRLNSRGGDYIYRLPTESEWEYAARAGTTGDYAGNLDSMAWYTSNSDGRTHPSGTKQPNAWGLYDMHGNVWEWVQDWYGAYPSGEVTDPQGPTSGSGRVIRGGGWIDSAAYCRSAYRNRGSPGYRSYYLGFRLVRTLR